MRKYFYSVVLATVINALVFAPYAIPATLGYQIDMLLSQVRTTAGGAITAGHVHFYEAGTTTNKTIWTTVNKNTPAANPYNLDANGTAYVFGDGLYRVVIHSAADTTSPLGVVTHGPTAYDRDNIRYEDFGTTMTRLTVITGDNTGTLSGFKTISGPGTGNISGFDNLTVTGRTTTATLTVTGIPTFTGAPIFTDNTINGVDLLDNTVTSAKILDNSIASGKILDNTIAVGKIGGAGTRDNTTYLRGDGAWAHVLPSICSLSKSGDQTFTAGATYDNVTWETEDSDSLGVHSAGADNAAIVIPSGYTFANFYIAARWAPTYADNAVKTVRLLKNSTIIAQQAGNPWGLVSWASMIVTGWISVVAGDNVYVTANTDNTTQIYGTPGSGYSYFRAEFR